MYTNQYRNDYTLYQNINMELGKYFAYYGLPPVEGRTFEEYYNDYLNIVERIVRNALAKRIKKEYYGFIKPRPDQHKRQYEPKIKVIKKYRDYTEDEKSMMKVFWEYDGPSDEQREIKKARVIEGWDDLLKQYEESDDENFAYNFLQEKMEEVNRLLKIYNYEGCRLRDEKLSLMELYTNVNARMIGDESASGGKLDYDKDFTPVDDDKWYMLWFLGEDVVYGLMHQIYEKACFAEAVEKEEEAKQEEDPEYISEDTKIFHKIANAAFIADSTAEVFRFLYVIYAIWASFIAPMFSPISWWEMFGYWIILPWFGIIPHHYVEINSWLILYSGKMSKLSNRYKTKYLPTSTRMGYYDNYYGHNLMYGLVGGTFSRLITNFFYLGSTLIFLDTSTDTNGFILFISSAFIVLTAIIANQAFSEIMKSLSDIIDIKIPTTSEAYKPYAHKFNWKTKPHEHFIFLVEEFPDMDKLNEEEVKEFVAAYPEVFYGGAALEAYDPYEGGLTFFPDKITNSILHYDELGDVRAALTILYMDYIKKGKKRN